MLAPDAGQLDPWHVPQVLDDDLHHVVLLEVVALPGHEGSHLLAGPGQPDQHALPVGGVGLLGLLDDGLDDDAFGLDLMK